MDITQSDAADHVSISCKWTKIPLWSYWHRSQQANKLSLSHRSSCMALSVHSGLVFLAKGVHILTTSLGIIYSKTFLQFQSNPLTPTALSYACLSSSSFYSQLSLPVDQAISGCHVLLPPLHDLPSFTFYFSAQLLELTTTLSFSCKRNLI